jgi:hypothetical protein
LAFLGYHCCAEIKGIEVFNIGDNRFIVYPIYERDYPLKKVT